MISFTISNHTAVSTVLSALMLITLLALKELALASALRRRWQALARFLNVAIAPLTITFLVTVALTLISILR